MNEPEKAYPIKTMKLSKKFQNSKLILILQPNIFCILSIIRAECFSADEPPNKNTHHAISY
jgi:hypothetical protein